MSFIHTLYETVLTALFPLSSAEVELFSYSPKEALSKLPSAPPVPIQANSLFAYKDERVAKLIWNIKYKKSAAAVKIAGYALCQALLARSHLATPAGKTTGSENSIVLIPIPITPRRRHERGFNQCELLVDEIMRLDVDKRFVIEKNLLIRTQHTSRHTLKGRQDRLADAKGIFAVNETMAKHIQQGATLLVIDDVITTGSTLKEAMETLKSSGFMNVRGMSVAH